MNKYWVRIIINFVLLLFIMGAALLMQGCSGGSDSDDSCLATYGYDTDVVGSTGLTLKATTPHYTYISFEQMEAEYISLERCLTNTNTPGPTVIFASFNHIGIGGMAFYVYNSQTAYMNTDQEDWMPQRNCISDRKFLRHEFAHHVLWLNGLDESHENPLFEQCDALGPRTCNGEYCD